MCIQCEYIKFMCQGHQPVVQLIDLYIGDYRPCILCGCTHDPYLEDSPVCTGRCKSDEVIKKMKCFKSCKRCGTASDCATEDQDYAGYCRNCIYKGNLCPACGAPICSQCNTECWLEPANFTTPRWRCPKCQKHVIPLEDVPRLFK